MQPIPEAAMPVVEILRRDVLKPVEIPCSWYKYHAMLRWRCDGAETCPMGLHPLSKTKTPLDDRFAGGELKDHFAVREFARWWDSLTVADAKEAVDAIWPEEAKSCGI